MSPVTIHQGRDPQATNRILRSLPDWFGIEEAIESYVADSDRLSSYIATIAGETIGVALVNRHFPEAAELHLIAVHKDHRGGGIGSSLVQAIATDLREDRCHLLSVHTVGPSFVSLPYAQTRSFYTGLGFIPLQEIDNIDWSGPTLILVMPLYEANANQIPARTGP